jgi:uncharacterized protein YcbK (DUF882 family)
MLKQFKKGVRTQITKNFASTEFDCNCKRPDCTVTNIETDHVEALQKMRDKWGKSVKITSGFRCAAHNAAEGGASNSRHKVSDATDIQVEGMTPAQVADDCEHFNGLGRYDTFTHIDSRPLGGKPKARWDFRRKK